MTAENNSKESPDRDAKWASETSGMAHDRGTPAVLEARREVIGERLRMARKMAGLSQGQVARMIGIHRPSVSEAEAGRRRVPAEELAEYSRIYDVSTAWLTGTEPESVDPHDARIQLAARELGKLKPEDLDRVLQLLTALRGPEEGAS